MKRLADIFLGTTAFILLAPFLLVICLISLAAHGQGNVFFLQERIGYRGRPFRIVKFKTMTDKTDEQGNLLPDELRQTAWGHTLRKFSIDELLQLINVIKGDMSLVGPRPLVYEQVSNLNSEERKRFDVRPGITGLAQVCGRNDLAFHHRFRYDVWYVKHLSLVLDLQIIVMTVKVVLSGYGVEYNPVVQSQLMIKK